MKERPILFSGPMVRALLAGTKTQTRRAVKPQPVCGDVGGMFSSWQFKKTAKDTTATLYPNGKAKVLAMCPYGKVGDRLWVRETWQGPLLEEFESDANSEWMSPARIHQYQNPAHCQYAADGGPAPEFMDSDDNLQCRWRPSIHMNRWASRILLEITEVRVERLQDISEADAKAEGVDFLRHVPDADETLTAKQLYECLWDFINGDGAWASNPWCWCVSFCIASPIAPSAQKE